MTSYYEKSKERILAYQKKYRKEHPEKKSKQAKRYKLKYPEKVKEQIEKWKEENPEKVKEQRIRERTKKNPNWKPRVKLSEEDKMLKIEKIRQRNEERRLKLRFEIFNRDNFTCRYCGRKAPKVILEIDHKFPKSKGGKNEKRNYQTLCKDCNLGKGDKILTEFY